MRTVELLNHLHSQNIDLRLQNGKLKVSAPKGAMSGALKQMIGQQKDEIIAFLQNVQMIQQVDSETITAIPRVETDGPLPLSDGQARLWQLAQLATNAAVYNIPYAYQLNGRLDISLLTASLQMLAERHDILRTAMLTDDNGTVTQQATPCEYHEVPLTTINMLDSQTDELHKAIHQEVARPFDLEQSPLWRAVLYKQDDETHTLLLVFHHIIFDGWSADLFWHELNQIYTALSQAQTPALPELPIQYGDYAAWQQEWLQSEEKSRQLAYWQETLSGDVSTLKLPGMRKAQGSRNAGAQWTHGFPTALLTKLNALARAEGVSLYMVLAAAFNLTLSRFTEQKDLLVCTPLTGRTQPETESLIGYFNNIAVLRTQLDTDMSFLDLLTAVKTTVLNAHKNQGVPFQEVAGLSSVAHVPLTRAFFTLEEAYIKQEKAQWPDLTVEPVTLEEETADFDWSIFMRVDGEQLSSTVWYKAALFESETLQMFHRALQTVLETAVLKPTAPLNHYPVFEVADKQEDMAGHQAYVAPRTEVESKLQTIWQTLLKLPQVSVTANFFDLGGHSMLAVRLITEIETQFNDRKLPLSTLLHAPTIRQLATIISGDESETTWSSLVPIQVEGNTTPLFCIHGAGGNILLYRAMAEYMKPYDRPVYGLQSQGLDGQLPFHESVEEMATAYIYEIKQIQPVGPYLLMGYCLGGTIALEMAQQLNQQGEQVSFLGLLETYNWAKEAAPTVKSNVQHYVQKLEFHWRNFAQLERGEKQLFVKEKAKVAADRTSVWYGRVKSRFQQDEATQEDEGLLLARLWAHNDQVSIDYRPRPYQGTIHHFRPQKDYAEYESDELGWEEIALDGVVTHRLPVYPAGMLVEPYVSTLADEIHICLPNQSQ